MNQFSVSHKKTSNFSRRILKFIYNCRFLLCIKDSLYHNKRTGLVLVCRSTATLILRHDHCKISNRSIQNLFNCSQGTSKDYWKVNCGKFGENKVVKIITQFAEAVTEGVLQKKCSWKFRKIPRKTPVPESFF